MFTTTQDADYLLLKYYLPECLLVTLRGGEAEGSGEDVDTVPQLVPADSISVSVGRNSGCSGAGVGVTSSEGGGTGGSEAGARGGGGGVTSSGGGGTGAIGGGARGGGGGGTGVETTPSDEASSSSIPTTQDDGCDDNDEDGGDDGSGISSKELVRVLVSYEGKLRSVSVWGAVKRFISTAQHTLHYGAHFYALAQHPQVSDLKSPVVPQVLG